MLSIRNLLVFLLYASFFVIFSAISINRYFSVQIFQYDFGIFASTIYQLSHFKMAYINHISLGTIPFLGDHFQPSLALLSPLFWITSDIKILLFEQALAIVLTAFVIQKIALKKGLSFLSSLAISVIFLLYAGIENPLVTDWHPEPTAGLFLVLFIYFFLYGKNKFITPVLAIIFLGFKESNAITLSFFLISSFFMFPKRRKEIASYLIASVAWFFTTIKILIPHFSGREYFYSPDLPKSALDLKLSLEKTAKYEFVWKSIVSFGFLPLLARFSLIPVFGEIFIRIFPLHSFFESFTLGMHYNFYLGIFLALASIEGLLFVFNKFKLKNKSAIISIIFILFALLFAKKVTHSPVILATNPTFWRELHPRQDIFDALKFVPSKGSVASQNNLLSYLVLREEGVYSLAKGYMNYDPDIIVADLSYGQNPNNFYPSGLVFMTKEMKLLDKTKKYKRIDTGNKNFYIFQRVN
ncbi:MAG: DUF2079 domain-containing protein [Candidatus Levybacteria bacterium]|nr:DUF2079 domain-containing protein [Candidatus Levybacteria bacterium]